jgi:NADH:ubiquinone oxidoreductase subunit 5 (subunit L)/multisubunit Na+/H+ antiporter MnhA subunit
MDQDKAIKYFWVTEKIISLLSALAVVGYAAISFIQAPYVSSLGLAYLPLIFFFGILLVILGAFLGLLPSFLVLFYFRTKENENDQEEMGKQQKEKKFFKIYLLILLLLLLVGGWFFYYIYIGNQINEEVLQRKSLLIKTY